MQFVCSGFHVNFTVGRIVVAGFEKARPFSTPITHLRLSLCFHGLRASNIWPQRIYPHLATRHLTHMSFPQIQGILYAVFDATQGPKPVCQVPDGVVVPTATSEVDEPLISFDSLRNYIIPKPALCNHLVGFRWGKYLFLGYPVNIVGSDYERNSFTFNFVFIFDGDSDTSMYETVISRTTKMFKALEEQSRFLSDKRNVKTIDNVIEQMYQDLNSYSECQIPIDSANTVDIKLFPIFEAPPNIYPWQVPIATVRLQTLVDETWDPTLERVIPFINGVNSVRRIADLAEANYELTKQAIRHLVYYECIIIIGITQFANIYAPAPDLISLATPAVYHEFCEFAYQTHHAERSSSLSSISGAQDSASTPHSASSADGPSVSSRYLGMGQVFQLYADFQNGKNLYSWYNEHADLLHNIDVRRFIIFGVVKQVIYRVYGYPILDYMPGQSFKLSIDAIKIALDDCGIDSSDTNVALIQQLPDKPLHFDAICSDLRCSRAKVNKLLRCIGEWAIVNS